MSYKHSDHRRSVVGSRRSLFRVPKGCCRCGAHTLRTMAHTEPQHYLCIYSPQMGVGWLQSGFFPSSQIVSEAMFALPDSSLSSAFFPQSLGPDRPAGFVSGDGLFVLFFFSFLFLVSASIAKARRCWPWVFLPFPLQHTSNLAR